MKIIYLLPDNEPAIRQVAALLVEGFADHWPEAWPDLESALEEVRESLILNAIPTSFIRSKVTLL